MVIAHGTEEQKERFLEPILSAEEIWCQGFSEPESGSDLASLKTKAVAENGGWRITGQKVRTTFAHEAKWCSSSPGPIPTCPSTRASPTSSWTWSRTRSMCARCARSRARPSSTSFIEVYVADENVVGGVGNGWMVAITTLANERAGLGASAALGSQTCSTSWSPSARERDLADDPLVRDKVARLKIGIEGLRLERCGRSPRR